MLGSWGNPRKLVNLQVRTSNSGVGGFDKVIYLFLILSLLSLKWLKRRRRIPSAFPDYCRWTQVMQIYSLRSWTFKAARGRSVIFALLTSVRKVHGQKLDHFSPPALG